MKILARQCPTCNDIVYSRARHDMRGCSCGDIAVDGGFDYSKISYRKTSPSVVEIEVDATKAELYNDWNNRIDEYGLIKQSSNEKYH